MSEQFTHNDIPDVVRALYTGRRSGNVGPANHSGLIGPKLSERAAVAYAAALQNDRKRADYEYTATIEPYDADRVDEHLGWATELIEDLRKLL